MGNVCWFTYEYALGATHCLKAIEFNDGNEKQRLEGEYQALPTVKVEMSPDVSSAVGRFLTTSEISEADNGRLERCLADLLMINIQRHLGEESPVLLVEGPPLSKLIGRIGYRYPRPKVTIAFVTIRPEYLPQASGPSVMWTSDGWNGPFPGLQEDTVRRTYFRYKPMPIRLDIFVQGLQRFHPQYEKAGVPLGVTAKLRSISEDVLKFADYLSQREAKNQPGYLSGPPKKFTVVDGDGAINESLADAARGREADPSSKKRKSRTPDRSPHQSVGQGKRDLVRELTSVPKDAIFNTISIDKGKQVRTANSETLQQFFGKGGPGALSEEQNTLFLRFVQKKIIEEGKKRPYQYTVEDLKIWYEEFDRGEGGG